VAKGWWISLIYPEFAYYPLYSNNVELAKPLGSRPLNPPYEMINFSELHLTAKVEKFRVGI
jgi:hypothetical protein